MHSACNPTQRLSPIYPMRRSEAEIQADLYTGIKQLGLDPRLEVRGRTLDGRGCHFDLVVFWPENHRAICIIECKPGVRLNTNSKQYWKYSQFKLPIIPGLVDNYCEVIADVIDLARQDYKNAPKYLQKFWL